MFTKPSHITSVRFKIKVCKCPPLRLQYDRRSARLINISYYHISVKRIYFRSDIQTTIIIKTKKKKKKRIEIVSVLITCWWPNDVDNGQTKQHHDTECIPQIEHNMCWMEIHRNLCCAPIIPLQRCNAYNCLCDVDGRVSISAQLVDQNVFVFVLFVSNNAMNTGWWWRRESGESVSILIFLLMWRSIQLSWPIFKNSKLAINNTNIYIYYIYSLLFSMPCYTLFNVVIAKSTLNNSAIKCN